MDHPWLKQYDEGVPHSIGSYPSLTLVDFLERHARERPHDPAILFKGRRISYAEVRDAADALARSLAVLGISRGDRIALLMPNVPQFVIAEMAIWKLGAITAPISVLYTERELEQALATSSPETMVALTLFYDLVKQVQPRTALKRVIATSIKEYLPPALRVLFSLFVEKKDGHRIQLQEGDVWFQDLIREGATLGPVQSAARPEDPAVLLMSGGTTGVPKGVLNEHRALTTSGTQLRAWLREAIDCEDPSIMLPLPLSHTYGCSGAQSMSLVAGIPLNLIPNARDTGDMLKAISRDRPTLLCGVPALFNAMLAHPRVRRGKVDFTSIRACFSGAAALMGETKSRFEKLTGGRIVEGYSLTEAAMACCCNPFRGTNKAGSVGLPLPDVTVRIVDSEEGSKVMPPGEVGEITIRAPQIMRGYWKNPDETAALLRLDDEGSTWLHTGDLGTLDPDGFLFIVDRKKDLIKVSGYQVWPREIEEVIATHPAVAEVGVAGVPDEKRGDVVHAWIVLRPEAPPVTEEELRAFCRETLARYKVPSKVHIRESLPKTMIGKILRRALVAEEREAQKAAQSPATAVAASVPAS